MFDDLINDPITLRLATGGYVDGKPQFTDSPASCLQIEKTVEDINRWGDVKNSSVFLIKSHVLSNIPLESQMEYNNRLYDIKQVRVCKDLDNIIQCFRVLVA